VHDLQERAHKNFEASRDRSLPVFGVGVVFIDESAVLPIPAHEMEEAVEVISLTVSSLAPPRKELHFVPIEIVYSSDSSDGKDRLIELMNVVSDTTGREDMLLSLRMLALQKVCFWIFLILSYRHIHMYLFGNVFNLKLVIIFQVASEFGYNRILLGSCISRIAAHVLSATVKVCSSFIGKC
jgi:cytoplasmic tRNA 2-thiolation protein 2